MTERDHVLEEAKETIVRLRAGVPAGTPMHLGNLLNAVLGRAEAAEKENNEFRRALDKGLPPTIEAQSEINHWRARAEAAEVGLEFERWFGKLLTTEGLRLVTETEDTLVYVARDTDFAALSLTVRKKNLPNPPPKRLIVTTSYQPETGADQPRRCETNQVGAMGECLACDAEQGEHCKLAALGAKP